MAFEIFSFSYGNMMVSLLFSDGVTVKTSNKRNNPMINGKKGKAPKEHAFSKPKIWTVVLETCS